ncbi:MAG: thioether cross-link-forming SCIFF peptide maturase [Dethiobacteria bacterium]
MFRHGDLSLAYDVNSGSLHLMDALGWDLVSLLSEGWKRHDAVDRLKGVYPPEEIQAALQQLDELEREKLFFSQQPVLQEGASITRGVKSLCLFITHACNLYCRYCFARKEGNYRPLHMSQEVARRAVDFLLEAEGPRHREIDFFGGEPLLQFPLIRDTVDYARKRAASLGRVMTFTVTTNALLLSNEVIDYLNSENINVIISIDGRPEVHNLMRPGGSGLDSYQVTIDNALNFLQKRKFADDYIRGTYTRENLDFSADLKHFLDLGFTSLSLEPVVASEKEDYALREEDLPRLEKEYDRLAQLYLERKLEGRPFVFYHFEMDLERGPCLYKRLSGCGAGLEYLAVSPGGDLYPCHHFIEEKAFHMGNLLERPFTFRREIGEGIYGSAKEREECHTCWARYLCGMGCPASSVFMAGDMKKTYALGCSLQRIRLERALYLQAALAVAKDDN